MNCEFCNASLKTKSSLNYHKKTNLKCLDLQNKTITDLFSNCNFCDRIFTNQTLKKHLITCKHKKIKEEENNMNLFENEKQTLIILLENEKQKYEQQNIEIEKLKKENSILHDTIIKLEAENKIYLQDRELVQKLAMQPKNTTTTNNDNRINNNFFDDPERIKRMINEKLNEDYVCDGQKGVAQFAYDTLLKDEDGNKNYICSDPSRHIFKFKNSDGNIEKDVKAIKLTNMLIDAGISSKSYAVAQTLWTKENGDMDPNKFEQYGPSQLEITELNMDNSIFRNKLAVLTSL